jgi:hypothetical protein
MKMASVRRGQSVDEEAVMGITARVVRHEHNPNTGCLEGMRCPSCASFGPFDIEATQTGTVKVSDAGPDLVGALPVWGATAACECCACQYQGTVGAFRGETPPQFDAYQTVTLKSFAQGQFKNSSPAEMRVSEDSLLQYLLRELSQAQGCYSMACAAQRVNMAIHELVEVRDAFVKAALNR